MSCHVMYVLKKFFMSCAENINVTRYVLNSSPCRLKVSITAYMLKEMCHLVRSKSVFHTIFKCHTQYIVNKMFMSRAQNKSLTLYVLNITARILKINVSMFYLVSLNNLSCNPVLTNVCLCSE